MRKVMLIAMVLAAAMQAAAFAAVTRDEQGWSVFAPCKTAGQETRLIYVSSGKGDDATARVHSCGDAEVGADPFHPAGAIKPYKTVAAALGQLGKAAADWVLFEKGQAWEESLTLPAGRDGLSMSDPLLLGAYGNGARPVFHAPMRIGGRGGAARFLAIVGLHVYDRKADPDNKEHYDPAAMDTFASSIQGDHCLVEDCKFDYTTLSPIDSHRTTVRRNYIGNAYAKKHHISGMWTPHARGLLIEENVFYQTGWHPKLAKRTMFNHAIYFSAEVFESVIRGNIFIQPPSVGIQSRAGGVIENNLFIDCAFGAFTSSNPSVMRDNVFLSVLDVDKSLPFPNPVPRVGLNPRALSQLTERNLFVNRLYPTGGPAPALHIQGTLGSGGFLDGGGEPSQAGYFDLPPAVHRTRYNTVYNWGMDQAARSHVMIEGNGFAQHLFEKNIIQSADRPCAVMNVEQGGVKGLVARANRYHSIAPAAEWFQQEKQPMDYAAWGKLTGDKDATLEPVPFADPKRTLFSYMEQQGIKGGTLNDLVAVLKARSRDEWANGRWSAPAINAYLREGFRPTDWPRNVAPTLKNAGATVPRGSGVIIGAAALSAQDPDNQPSELVYLVDEIPEHGVLRVKGRRLVRFEFFTQEDIDSRQVAYEHAGAADAPEQTDRIRLRVTDGQSITDFADVVVTFGQNTSPDVYALSNRPPVIKKGQVFEVKRDALVNTVVGRIVVDDPDAASGQPLHYGLEGYDMNDKSKKGGLFRVNPWNGDIIMQYFPKDYGRETRPYGTEPPEVGKEYILKVYVIDDGTRPLRDEATVIVRGVAGSGEPLPAPKIGDLRRSTTQPAP